MNGSDDYRQILGATQRNENTKKIKKGGGDGLGE